MIQRKTAQKLVARALQVIADVSGDVDDFSTTHLHDAHIKAFITALDKYLREELVVDKTGNQHPGLQYSAPLSMTLFKSWKTFGECVDHIVNNHDIAQR